MKKYTNFLLENISIDLDSFISILKEIKLTDNNLFNKLINKHKVRLIKDIMKSKNDEYFSFFIENVDDLNFPIDDNERNILFDCKEPKCVYKFLELGVDPTTIDKRGWNLIYV